MLWDSTHSGTGILCDDADEDLAASTYRVADRLQEAAVEALWGERKSAVWPECADHPNSHPLRAELRGEGVVWECPASSRRVAAVGELAAAR